MLPNKTRSKNPKGFTLVELLVVIGLLTVLMAITIVAINPSRQFKQANNAQRRSDINAILNAVHQWSIENAGDLSQLDGGSGLPLTATNISSTGGDVDLCDDLTPTYIAEMPYDPTAASADFTDCDDYNTGYSILSTTGPGYRVTLSAPSAELNETISITR